MIYQYTGQPGHGKTLHAIDKALKWVDEGRDVYACNIRNFQAAKAGMIEITPEQFRTWEQWAPDGACFLIDECYEHGMLPKRAPGVKVPPHVEQLAKHRHRGLDFIFVAQSPTKQMDAFVHDLIECHIHVRRRFGTLFVHLREFDRFESNPVKAHPLVVRRVLLPKRPMGLYESTKLDTTQKRIPWYYPAAVVLVIGICAAAGYTYHRIQWQFDANRFSGKQAGTATGADGAGATAKPGDVTAIGSRKAYASSADYAVAHAPRIAMAPWSSPVYDGRSVSVNPELVCVVSHAGNDAQGQWTDGRCTCFTEQGTRYAANDSACRAFVANGGVYNPYRRESRQSQASATQAASSQRLASSAATVTGASISSAGIAAYGQMTGT